MSDIDALFDEHEVSSSDRPPFAEFDTAGDSLRGVIEETREAFDENYLVADVRPENGDIVTTPTHAVLRGKLEQADVAPGDAVRIVYQGEIETNNGHMAKDYDVAVIPASDVPDDWVSGGDDDE